jgi:hypothetical protein
LFGPTGAFYVISSSGSAALTMWILHWNDATSFGATRQSRRLSPLSGGFAVWVVNSVHPAKVPNDGFLRDEARPIGANIAKLPVLVRGPESTARLCGLVLRL